MTVKPIESPLLPEQFGLAVHPSWPSSLNVTFPSTLVVPPPGLTLKMLAFV